MCMLILFWHIIFALIIIVPTYKLDVAISKRSTVSNYISVDPVKESVAPASPPVFSFGTEKKVDKMERIINRIKEVIGTLK